MAEDTIYREDALQALVDCEDIKGYAYRQMEEAIKAIPSTDRPSGYWIKIDVATYKCSECGKIQYADDENELNYCCCCGSKNKLRYLKGVTLHEDL